MSDSKPMGEDKLFWINGIWKQSDQALVSAEERSFLLGDGLFETLRVQQRKLCDWNAHWQRLQNSLAWAQIQMPWTGAEMEHVGQELIRRSQASWAALRLTVSRGPGGQGLGCQGMGFPTVTFMLRPFPHDFLRVRKKGWKVGIASVPRSVGGPEWSHKALHFLPAVREKIRLQKQGLDEAIWLDPQGYALEALSANLFVLQGHSLITPPCNGSILPGIMRQKVLTKATALHLNVQEKLLRLEDLQQADCCFLTNSIWGLIPLRELNGKKWTSFGDTWPLLQESVDPMDENSLGNL